MIVAALVVMALMWWAHRLLFRRMRSPRETTTVAGPVRRASGKVPPLGLEDDSARWDATRNAWTALDEHQLTRLLRASVQINGAAPIPTNTAVPRVGREDMP